MTTLINLAVDIEKGPGLTIYSPSMTRVSIA